MPLTTRTSNHHRYQAQRIITRLSNAGEDAPSHCQVVGCKNPLLRSLGKGIGRFCQSHQSHQRRHGHPTRGSFSGTALGPYRRASYEYLQANLDNPFIHHALKAIVNRLDHSGEVVNPHELRGADLRKRANAVWSRLREREISPVVILSVALGVELALQDDPDPPRGRRYARVQMAKVIAQLSGGVVLRWQEPGGKVRSEFTAFQQSQGLFLITLGQDLERAGELVVDHHGEAVREHLKRRLLKWKKGNVRPYPVSEGNSGRKASIFKAQDWIVILPPAPKAIEKITSEESGISMEVVRM
jgi:hypothetical protein